MRKSLILATCFIIITLSFSSCEKNCKVCQQNTYDSGNHLLSAGTETDYCGADLLVIEATKDVTYAGVTTRWVCR